MIYDGLNLTVSKCRQRLATLIIQREIIMKIINIAKLLAASSIISISVSQVAFAHPGRTAADGCHYCRTNCSSWGVPWNERHCHGHSNADDHSSLVTAAHDPSSHNHEMNYLNIEADNQEANK